MGKIRLIISREYFTRVRKKSFIIMTLVAPILIGGLITVGIWMSLAENGVEKVLVCDDTNYFIDHMQNNDQVYFYNTSAPYNKALSDFKDSSFTLMLYVPEIIISDPKATCQLVFKKQPSIRTQTYIASLLDAELRNIRLEHYDVSKDTFDLISTRVNLTPVDVDTGESDKYKQERAGVGYFFSILIYMFIFMYGVQVMRGVIEEKTSRIVEIIISSVKPFQLMMGKIIGVALVGLTQFLAWVIITGAIIIGAQMTLMDKVASPVEMAQVQMTKQVQQQIAGDMVAPPQNEVIDFINRINWPLMLGMFLFYFLGGYLLYSSLFAAVGAAVDAESDTQQFMMPLTIPLVVGFIVSQFVIQNPEGPAAFWFSLIPFTSPVVMLVRVAMGFEPGTIWQLYLSMGLLIAGFLFTTWLAGRIYRIGILMYGKKPTYRELWKWLFYNG